MKVLTVGDLRAALEKIPDSTPLGFSVYNHSWYANCHLQTHGAFHLDIGIFPGGEEIAIIYDDWPRNGYEVKLKNPQALK